MKKLGFMEMGGEFLVVFCALLWISRMLWVPYGFALGTILFSIGRLAQGNEGILAETPEKNQLTMIRLIRQRNISIVFLMLAAVFMLVKTPMHLYEGFYLLKSSWLVPFICFTVIEVYTTFRMSHLIK